MLAVTLDNTKLPLDGDICMLSCSMYTNDIHVQVKQCSAQYQGRRRRSGWSGLSRTNNLELNQLVDQLELYYSHAIFGRSHLHVATYILQMLLKMHDTSSYLVSQPN